MQKFFELTTALEYIEQHLLEPFAQEDIAKEACVSLSALQKLFRYTFGYSLNEYITNRKMTVAAEELSVSRTPLSVLAQKYGYNSTEAFSRAFSKVNCCLPSEYRKKLHAKAMFTPLMMTEEGVYRDSPVLIDAIQKRQNCYIVCFDVAGMKRIHEISREAGELALMETVRRIHTHATKEMQILRIGRDEFALITPFEEEKEAKAFVSSVLEHNGDSFLWKSQEIPLNLRSWYGKLSLKEHTKNPAYTLRDSVKYHGIMEVSNEEN